jgi:membrane protease YdiL (CAAX protease family)
VVVLNVFAQVFTTSTAEVLVVYALVGVAGAWMTRSLGNVPSGIVGIALASVLFGAYHIAHSPPFSTLSMILLLTFVGVVTGVFYFLVREIYATIVFHNFPALFGVMQNVDPAMFASPNTFLLGTMLITVVILVGTERYLLRR